ncbi:COMM domain-containing protein 8-like isoform X8 [Dermacentor variabilis]|uniref:COMM domain-containing protein 8-like isoform X8 n=1 Tax=Dermacentor variabilis TaxID=34621 RepID=UPI003F5CA6B4
MAAATSVPWLSLLSKFPAERAEKGLLDVLPATHQAVVRKVTQSRREDIRHQLLHKTDDIGARALTDLDWSVKLVFGSDTVPSLGGLPLAYLSLFMGDDTVCIEVSVAEVGRLIASLEAAHKLVRRQRSWPGQLLNTMVGFSGVLGELNKAVTQFRL